MAFRDGIIAAVAVLAFAWFSAKFNGIDAKFDAKFASVDAKLDSLVSSIAGLTASTLTPAAAQVVLRCAEASVYVLFMPPVNASLGVGLCSAFAYARGGDGAILLVSASHCFTALANPTTTSLDATRLQLGWGVRVKCTLVNATFLSDSALLRCTDSAPLLVRASSPAVLAQAVVAAGYCNDVQNVTPFSVHQRVSLQLLSSTVSVSMGPYLEGLAADQGAPPPPP